MISRLGGSALRDTLAHRQVTADLIASEGVVVTLLRVPQRVPDGAGGHLVMSTAKLPQNPVQRFFSLVAAEPQELTVAEGDTHNEKFVLIGPHDDDIVVLDQFKLAGVLYEVKYIHSDTSYQVKAEGICVDDGRR